jgi:hypothetical protein
MLAVVTLLILNEKTDVSGDTGKKILNKIWVIFYWGDIGKAVGAFPIFMIFKKV